MRLTLAAVGFTSTIAQVVLLRELVATFYGNELLLGLILMAWLAWVAAGAWLLPRYLQPPTSNLQLPASNFQPPISNLQSLISAGIPQAPAATQASQAIKISPRSSSLP